jgi:transposase
MDTVDSAISKPVRRLEVFTGAGRRRTWSDEDKARVVAEIAASGDTVSGVARRHGLSPQQLFGWRRQVRESQAVVSSDDEVRFRRSSMLPRQPRPGADGARLRASTVLSRPLE